MDVVLYEVDEGVATVTLNRPHRRNAWTGRMETEYRSVLQLAEADEAVRVIIITGSGDSFCVGADSRALEGISASKVYDSGVRDPLPVPGRRDETDLTTRHGFLWGLSKPVIAAVNGPAAGIGFVIMCYSDFRYAAEGAKITTTFARLGLPAEYGVSWVLPRLIGAARAADILLTSRILMADEAERIGFVNRTFPPGRLLTEVTAIARHMAHHCAPSSLGVIKQQLYDDMRGRSLAGSEHAYDTYLAQMVTGDDFHEGVEALREHRLPEFLSAPPIDPPASD